MAAPPPAMAGTATALFEAVREDDFDRLVQIYANVGREAIAPYVELRKRLSSRSEGPVGSAVVSLFKLLFLQDRIKDIYSQMAPVSKKVSIRRALSI